MEINPPAPPAPQDGELSEAFYTAMRDELMKRLELREHTLALTTTILAALLGFGASAPDFKPNVLFIISPLSLGSTILVLEHSSKLAFIAEYLDKECRRYARRVGSKPWQPWETSSQVKAARASEYRLRGLGESVFLLLPLSIALILAFPTAWVWFSQPVIAWLVEAAVAVIVITLIARHFIWRSSYHRHSDFTHDAA